MTTMTNHAWLAAVMIGLIVAASSAGDVLTARAMKSIGDLDEIRAQSGLPGAIKAVLTCPFFLPGVSCLALAFFSLLFALNQNLDLSLIGPAAASLTLVANNIAASLFLKERVGKRRWVSAIMIAFGVYFLTH